MTVCELVELMFNLGCTEALILDEGGSSTMVVGERLVKSPTEKYVETVSDALLILNRCENE